jgi:hypothetical protein
MKASGSLSDIAGSVKGYLEKKQQRQSLASELWQARALCQRPAARAHGAAPRLLRAPPRRSAAAWRSR